MMLMLMNVCSHLCAIFTRAPRLATLLLDQYLIIARCANAAETAHAKVIDAPSPTCVLSNDFKYHCFHVVNTDLIHRQLTS